MVICLKKGESSLDLDSFMSKDASVVAYAIGDRSGNICRKLWEAIPEAYRTGHCYTDFWAAYQTVIPEKQHTAVGKETGQTARARALE